MKSTTSIKSRLVNGLMLIVLFFLVQAGLVWYAIDNAKSTVVENTRKNTIATSELSALAILAQQIRRYEKEYFVYVGNKEKRDSYQREWREALGGIDATLQRIRTGRDGAFTQKDIEQVAAWTEATAFYASEMQKVFVAVGERSASLTVAAANPIPAPVAKPGAIRPVEVTAPAAFQSAEVNEMIKAGKDRFSANLIKGVEAMGKSKTADTLALASIAQAMFDKVLAGVMITVAIGIAVALLLSISLPRAVTRTIDGLSIAAQEMSTGSLQKPYDSGGVVEFDKLAEALNRMRLGQQALVERLQKRH